MGTTDTYCNATTLAVHGALQIWSAGSSTRVGTSSRIDKPGQVPSSGMATSSTSSEITSPTPLASTGTRARTARGNHTLSARDAPSTTDAVAAIACPDTYAKAKIPLLTQFVSAQPPVSKDGKDVGKGK